MKKQIINSLEEFRATRKKENAKEFASRNGIPEDNFDTENVFSYCGNLHISILDEQTGFRLDLIDSSFNSEDIASLDEKLYEWAVAEKAISTKSDAIDFIEMLNENIMNLGSMTIQKDSFLHKTLKMILENHLKETTA